MVSFYHISMKTAINCVKIGDPSYPALLKEIAEPPKEIFFIGVLPKNNEHLVAIVGTRKATSDGKLLTKQIARELTQRNISVVSGLALGIDASAHEGAVSADGKTIAVLANGLDSIYPRQNEHLAEKIIDRGGCIISEYPEGTLPFPNQFLERNRIISGLCLATVVIEAPERSGAIATARNAIEQGREVFVFPGPSSHPNYKGSHALIRNGARLITSVEDIFDDLGEIITTAKQDAEIIEMTSTKKIGDATNDKTEMLIISALASNKKALSVDNLIELTTLEPRVVHQYLTMLLVKGIVEESGNLYTIKK